MGPYRAYLVDPLTVSFYFLIKNKLSSVLFLFFFLRFVYFYVFVYVPVWFYVHNVVGACRDQKVLDVKLEL